ncbi:MAG: ompa/motb domain protein [Bacteroidetes bacterium]|nr:MAG: ompa/motb domain protein [Bacteroidota bacterium]
MTRTVLVSGLFAAALPAFAQQDSTATPPKELPSIHLGIGMNIFNGDVGKESGIQTSIRPAFTFAVEHRFSNFIGAGLDASYGKLAKSERSITSNRNFESTAMQFGLHGIFYFDNNAILERGVPLAPYITAGAGYLLFDPYGDLKDASGNTYFYWSDGSIRNQPELPANQLTAVILQRDHEYETQLKDSTSNYARNSVVVPIGLGLRFSFGHNLGGSFGGTYNLCFTDYVDNVKESGNDSYLQLGASVFYKFGKVTTTQQAHYADVNFAALEKEDYDGDGVPENKDDCPGTPKGVQVDKNGCPLDEDRDGVPDYRDKEPKSKKGFVVDENGVALDYQKIAEDAVRDSIAQVRDSLFQADPSTATLNRIEKELAGGAGNTGGTSTSTSKIPEDIRAADKDNNGFIAAAEITKAIDDFFNGEGDWTVEKINRLIDYFFEQ